MVISSFLGDAANLTHTVPMLVAAIMILLVWGVVMTFVVISYMSRYTEVVKNYSDVVNNYAVVSMDIADTFKEVSNTTTTLIRAIDGSCETSKDNKTQIINRLIEMEGRVTETINRNAQFISSLAQKGDVHIFNTQADKGNVAQGMNTNQDIHSHERRENQ